MPALNSETFVEEAVESILSQTCEDFEFLIFNDGSTDGTPDILENLSKRDKRIQLFHRDHVGLAPLLSEGLSRAKGTFLARMDADDISLPTRLQEQADFLSSNPDHVLIAGSIVLIDRDGDVIGPKQRDMNHREIVDELLVGKNPIPNAATLVSRQAVEAAGGFDESYPYAGDFQALATVNAAREDETRPEHTP